MFLAIATNIPQWLKTGFVVQGHALWISSEIFPRVIYMIVLHKMLQQEKVTHFTSLIVVIFWGMHFDMYFTLQFSI